MLELKNIKKDYYVAGKPVPALKGINLTFKDQEFVSILGPSGCGKTTMLNIIGGLDRYTSGDLLIDSKSTKDYKDQDWDAYRNATIGFVFQTYNLISHLSVLDNVEMALRLSGVGAKERKDRAIKVLTEVGLKDHLYKRPNQLSGGQMQRVAIARALVNNPKILLADEPTGALDSKTSDQIMKLIKEISRDRLVIMVTHNAEIAESYSDRVVQLLDGLVVDDSNPSENIKDDNKVEKLVNKKTAMSYKTALLTSFKNLLTKKGRTLITALAGSIGIIGIALVLSISSGMTSYVNEMQSDTLAGFPLMVNPVVTDYVTRGQQQFSTDGEFPDTNLIYSFDPQTAVITHTNIITDDFLTYLDAMDQNLYNSITYSRAVQLNIISQTTSGYNADVSSYFNELPNNPEFIQSQYDILEGTYPTNMNEVVIVVDNKNQLNINFLEAIGYQIDDTYQFSDFIGHTFKVIPNNEYYGSLGGIYYEKTDYETMYQSSEAVTLTVTGILRVNQDATSDLLDSGIAYTNDLTTYVLNDAQTSDIVLAQEQSPDTFVLGGIPFNSSLTYKNAMLLLGGDSTPVGIQIYPKSFESKDAIKTYIDDYNKDLSDADQVIYTDLAEIVSTAIGSLINTITIILSAFAGISLVVSSIMIGIITYVSVVERTKEIGIMRSLGARKKDISRIFNAETVLIGFTAGILGVLIASLLTIPINLILENYIEVSGFAKLLLPSAVILVVLSTGLTLIAGLFPSRIAAKKDPVIALRTE
ncbi:MAG: ATP-binding cassette domain-containing protein [Acholeplasmataceae bacterium]